MPYVIMWLLGVPLSVILLLWVVGIGRWRPKEGTRQGALRSRSKWLVALTTHASRPTSPR